MKSYQQIQKLMSNLLLSVAMFYGSSCGTWVGNPTGDSGGGDQGNNRSVSLSVQATGLQLEGNSIPVKKIDGSAHGFIKLDKALFSVSDIKLGNILSENQIAGEFKGPYLIDAIKSQIFPTPDAITVPEGTYHDLMLSFHTLKPGDIAASANGAETAPAIDEAIYGSSVFLAGTWQLPDGSSRKFSVALELDDPIFLKNSGSGFDIQNSANNLIVALRMDQWFAFDRVIKEDDEDLEPIDFASYGEGDIVLDKSSTGKALQLRNQLEELIEHSADHGIDADGDGKLSSLEDEFDDDDDESADGKSLDGDD